MRDIVRGIVDRLVHPSLARAERSPAPAPAPPPADDETMILAREIVALRRRLALVESRAPERFEEVRTIAVDAAIAARSASVALEAEATNASARFAYLRADVARYRDEAARAREIATENSERAGDAVLGARDAAGSVVDALRERSDAVLAELNDGIAALRASLDTIAAEGAKLQAELAALVAARDAAPAREARDVLPIAEQLRALAALREDESARLERLVARDELEQSLAKVRETLGGIGGRLDTLETILFPLPGATPQPDRIERIEVEAVRALEGVEQLRRALAWHPDPDAAVFDGNLVAGNGSHGDTALSERFKRTFGSGADERHAARVLVGAATDVLVIGEADVSADRCTQIEAEHDAVAHALREAQPGSHAAIVALAYPERSGADERFALLRGAAHALREDGVLVLGITNGYAPEAWRRFHLDPWNVHPWMPDTWRFALATAGFRGARFYEPSRREYVTDVTSASGRILLVGYR